MARLLRRIAEEVLGREKASRVWGRVDVVGDIALIKSPRIAGAPDPLTLDDYRKLADALIERMGYVRSVWLLTSPTLGDELVREAVHLAGEKRSVTIYKEHGCHFKVDVLRVFVTPRLNFEHSRVAALARPGEVVVNMFAGAGIASIVMACRKPVVVYSIDKSVDAYLAMVENVELNRRRLRGRVIPIHGDAAYVIENKLRGVADRVLEPYPRLALEYLGYAVDSLRGKGVIHVYLHVWSGAGEGPIENAVSQVASRLEALRLRSWRILGARRVRRVGPRYVQVVVDVEVDRGGG